MVFGRANRRTAALNRVYAVESTFSVTGAAADHRLRLASGDASGLRVRARKPARRPRTASTSAPIWPRRRRGAAKSDVATTNAAWVRAVAGDSARYRGRGAVVAGPKQPPAVHALVHLINLGARQRRSRGRVRAAVRRGLRWSRSARRARGSHPRQEVDTLIILGSNPAFDAPADAEFASALAQVPTSVHLSTHLDETSSRCDLAHQPRALPRVVGRRSRRRRHRLNHPAAHRAALRRPDRRASRSRAPRLDRQGPRAGARDLAAPARRAESEPRWRRALHDGVVDGTAYSRERPRSVPAKWPTR